MNPHVERAIENKISARVRSRLLTTWINGWQVTANSQICHAYSPDALLSRQIRHVYYSWHYTKISEEARHDSSSARTQTLKQVRSCTLSAALYLITFYLSIIYLDARNLRIQTGLRLHLASTEAQVNRARNKQKQTRIVTCCWSKY